MMQHADDHLDTETEFASPLSSSLAREPLEALAIDLAQKLRLSHSTTHGKSVQSRLRELEIFIRSVYRFFEENKKTKAPVQHAAEWILDNFYVIEQTVRQVKEGMPTEYYRRLPRVSLDKQETLARIQVLSMVVTDAVEGGLDIGQLNNFVRAYQEVDALKIGEIWAFPLMLRLSILEMLSNALSKLTQITFSAYRHANILQKDVADSPQLAGETIVANCILSLRLLSTHDWKLFFERISIVEGILRNEPSGIYARMDFSTRNRYRDVIEKMALGSDFSEAEIAKLALQLAANAEEDRQRHIGYYLIDDGRKTLEETIKYRASLSERFRDSLYKYAIPFYLGSIILLTSTLTFLATFICMLLGGNLAQIIFATLFSFLPVSSVAVDMVNWFVVQLIPPRILPKLDCQTGIPQDCKTAIVIPALLKGSDELQALLRQLENHYLANPDSNLFFALLTDFADAHQKELPGEQELIDEAKRGIAELNNLYGGKDLRPFYLFHRERIWNSGEDCWMGWERKRGKLVEFNYLIRKKRKTSYVVKIGDLQKLHGIRYVITLDADTVLPREGACRLVGTLAHPLNQAQFESADGGVKAGYTILQPRVQVRPRVANQSIFTRIYSGDQTLDLYTRAISDVYQDLFGEGNYVGKGIYDVEAFERSLEGRVPDNHILSHDLFEGIHGRCGLVTDVVLFEDFPPGYLAYSHRLHRWVRGDWQLFPWLRSQVPLQQGKTIQNRLSSLDRWKIIDNLRRNLIAPTTQLLLLGGWFFLPSPAWFWTILALSVYFLLITVSAIAGSIRRRREEYLRVAERRAYQPWLRAIFAVIFLPHEALIVSEAILSTLVRLIFTRKRLLQWVTAAHTVKCKRSGGRYGIREGADLSQLAASHASTK